MCNVSLTEEHEQSGDYYPKQVSFKHRLFEQFYLMSIINLEESSYNTKSFDLNFQDFLSSSEEDSRLLELLGNMKLCTIGEYNKVAKSKSIFSSSSMDFKSLLKREHVLSEDEYKLVNSDPILKIGGYYKPPICLQEFLYYHASDDDLKYLKKIIQNFNYQTDERKIRKNNFLDNIAEYSLKVIKSKLNSTQNRQKYLDKISEFIKTKENDLTIIVVPYLKRKNNLIDLLYNLHSFLQRQFIHYKLIIAEQYNSNDPFNKGRLYNTAFSYINNDSYITDNENPKSDSKLRVKCLILHDVDLIPESDYNIYDCGSTHENKSPRHLSLSIRSDSDELFEKSLTKRSNLNELYIQSPYELLVGGVLCIRPNVFKLINGFSNEYWNWGAEDDGSPFSIYFFIFLLHNFKH